MRTQLQVFLVRYIESRPLRKFPSLYIYLLSANMWRVKALRQWPQETDPDVVLSFLGATNILTIASARGLLLRVVISERNDPALQELNTPWEKLRRVIYPMADLVTANSHGAIEYMQNYCPAAKLAYVPDPITSNTVSGCRENTVLFLARLIHQKGPDILVEAFARFAQQNPGWTLQVAGDGPMKDELIGRVCDYGIVDRVVFHGMIKDPTGLLARSRVFVLPSRFEGTPNSLLEAMAARLPCIISDSSPGPLTLIQHDVSGLVVRTGDTDHLTLAMHELAQNPELCRRLGEAAWRRTSEFQLNNVVETWERLLFPDAHPA